MLRDLAVALRRLLRNPAFSATAVLLLGLALGANLSVFSVLYALLYKPLPFAQAERVVALDSQLTTMHLRLGLSVPLLEALQRDVPALQDLAGYRERSVSGRDEDAAVSYAATAVQPGVFRLLGAHPAAGRLLNEEDAAPGAAPVAVLGWDLARQRFGGAAAVGRSLRLASGDVRIVGVLAPEFGFPRATNQLWLPLVFSAAEREAARAGSFGEVGAIARLAPGAMPAAVEAQIDATARGLAELKDVVDIIGLRVPCRPLRELWLDERAPALRLMLLALGVLLLVALTTVCNLVIARQVARQRELALQRALGADAWRCLRQVAAEGALLAGGGAVLALALLTPALALLRRLDLVPTDAPQAIGIDAVSVLFLIALAALAALAIALAAALSQRRDLAAALQGGARLTGERGEQRARQVLIVAQIGVTAALLLGVGLLLRSSQRLLAEDVGFEQEGLALGNLSGLPPTQDQHVPTPAEQAAAHAALRALRERVRALPGVEAVGYGSITPFGSTSAVRSYDYEQGAGQGASAASTINYARVDAGYFAALGVRLLRGRAFTPDEARDGAAVAVVDAEFARRAFGEREALGQSVHLGDKDDAAVRVIGVVPTLKQHALDEAVQRAMVYRPQEFPVDATLLVRTRADAAALSAPLQAALHAIAPQARLSEWQPMRERLRASVRDRLRLDALLQCFGAVALALAAVGLYAVLAYAVRARTAEFGVRLALGADAARLARGVLGQGAVLIGAGFAVAMPLGWGFARVLRARLYHVDAFDPVALGGVLLLFGATGLLACWLPARRAAQVDPNVALRRD